MDVKKKVQKFMQGELAKFLALAAYMVALGTCLANQWGILGGLLAMPGLGWMLYLAFFGEDGGGHYRTVYLSGRAVHQWRPYR